MERSKQQIEVEPGEHSVRARMLGGSSELRRFTASEELDSNKEIVVGLASAAVLKGIYAPGRVLDIQLV